MSRAYLCPDCKLLTRFVADAGAEYPEELMCPNCGGQAVAGAGGRRAASAWPQYSDAFGCGTNPVHIRENEKALAEAGIPTKFDPQTGRAEVLNNAHRNKLCKYFKLGDKDACFGQVAPTRIG